MKPSPMVTGPMVAAGISSPLMTTESPSGSTPTVGIAIRTAVPAKVRAFSGLGLGESFGSSLLTTVITTVADEKPPTVSRIV